MPVTDHDSARAVDPERDAQQTWPEELTARQVRIARPTDRLEAVTAFYVDGLGLPRLGGFEGHDGYDGVFIGLPGTPYHLELTPARRRQPRGRAQPGAPAGALPRQHPGSRQCSGPTEKPRTRGGSGGQPLLGTDRRGDRSRPRRLAGCPRPNGRHRLLVHPAHAIDRGLPHSETDRQRFRQEHWRPGDAGMFRGPIGRAVRRGPGAAGRPAATRWRRRRDRRRRRGASAPRRTPG